MGTYVASTRFLAVDSETLDPKPNVTLVTRSAFSQPSASHGYGIPITGDLSVKAALSADILFLARGFFGLESYTFLTASPVAGVGRHRWTDFSNKPLDGTAGGTLSTESVTVNYDVNQVRYAGCWFNTLTLRQSIGQPLEFSWGTIGSALPVRAAADNTQSPATGKGFGNYDPSIPAFDVLLDGTSIKDLVKMLDIRMERTYDPNLFTSGSNFTLTNQSPGPTRITGTITTDKTDVYAATSLIGNLLARTEVTLDVKWRNQASGSETSAFEALFLTIPKIIFTGGLPHMRSERTPPGYEGAFTFEAYRQAAPTFDIHGENTTIA